MEGAFEMRRWPMQGRMRCMLPAWIAVAPDTTLLDLQCAALKSWPKQQYPAPLKCLTALPACLIPCHCREHLV